MRRNNIFIIQWVAWICFMLASCSGMEDELSTAIQTNESDGDTRANLVEYTINVETAGTLESLVETKNYSDAQKLIITGKINYSDVNYVDVNMPTVEVLDLSGTTYYRTYLNDSFLSSSTSIKEISLPGNITSIRGNTDSGPFYYCSSLTSITLPESLTDIGNCAFLYCSSLASITIPENVTIIGNGAFVGCSSLTSITIPESVTRIVGGAFDSDYLRIVKLKTASINANFYLNYSNMLVLYGAEDTTSTEGYDITTAKRVIYYYKTESHLYPYNQWYTISLPFKPTQITHEEKGTIAPFDSNVEGAKNFWLRELTPDGYQDVTEMEAGHAYIIAMPTSRDYSDEFKLAGTVTFSAENVTIDWRTVESKGPTYTMYPTYKTVNKSMDVYALNSTYEVDGYDNGSVWVRGAMDVGPFEAYVKLNEGAATMRSVLPMADGKRTAVRGASSSSDASTRGVYGQRKPRKEDM